MIYILDNIAAILAATVVGAAVGLVWLRVSGRGVGPGGVLAAMLGLFWLAAILAGALILAPVDAGGWTIALGTPVIIWGGFLLPGFAATLPALGHGWRTVVSASAVWLVAMLAMAAVLHAIGLNAPIASPAG